MKLCFVVFTLAALNCMASGPNTFRNEQAWIVAKSIEVFSDVYGVPLTDPTKEKICSASARARGHFDYLSRLGFLVLVELDPTVQEFSTEARIRDNLQKLDQGCISGKLSLSELQSLYLSTHQTIRDFQRFFPAPHL